MKNVIRIILIPAFVFIIGITFNMKKQDNSTPFAEEETLPYQLPTVEEKNPVDQIIYEMSLSDKVYQMMFVTMESITGEDVHLQTGEETKEALLKYPVGGIVYFADNFKNREQTVEMISKTQEYSPIPLFISVDEEGGRVTRLGKNKDMGVVKLPPMREIGNGKDTQAAYEAGKELAEDLKLLGFNMNFAPVADVIINKENREIGDRSFGTDAIEAGKMVGAFVKGMKEYNIIATLKHFPGHGSTFENSHNGYSESERTYQELKNEEFLPFKEGIRAGADFVMVSHMTLVNATKEKVASSVSKEVITNFLKEEIGFEGIVITDSFSMGAITDMYTVEEAAVKALLAGVDMILMPKDVKKAHDAILEAVENGRISEEKIEKSVRKILEVKKEHEIL